MEKERILFQWRKLRQKMRENKIFKARIVVVLFILINMGCSDISPQERVVISLSESRDSVILYNSYRTISQIYILDDGERKGPCLHFGFHGNVLLECNYSEGVYDGYKTGFDDAGTKIFSEKYSEGKLISKLIYNASGDSLCTIQYKDSLTFFNGQTLQQ